MNLPDLRRIRAVWLTDTRLVIGAVAATAAGAAAAASAGHYNPGRDMHGWVLVMQSAALFLYGIPALLSDFSEEHQKNTWDLLRLTPLEASEIVLSKTLASTSFAVFLAAVLAPWAFFAQGLHGAPGILALGLSWVWMAVSFAGTALTAVAAAAVAARLQGGRFGVAGLALGGLGCLVSCLGWASIQEGGSTVSIFGHALPSAWWLLATGCLWVFWGAVGAVRQVGRLLSERPAPLALPAFLATLWVYLNAVLPGRNRIEFIAAGTMCITFPALAALLAAMTEGGVPERSRPRVQPWAASWATVAVLSGLTALLQPADRRVAVMVPLFLARDLFLLARLRLSRVRNPEAVAFALLGALYLVPIGFVLFTQDVSRMYWFLPMEAPDTGLTTNVAPALLNVAAAAALFWSGLKARSRAQPADSAGLPPPRWPAA